MQLADYLCSWHLLYLQEEGLSSQLDNLFADEFVEHLLVCAKVNYVAHE